MTKEAVTADLEAVFGRKLLSKRELGSYLGVSKSTLDRQIAAGEGVAYIKRGSAKGNRVRYHISDVADYLMRTRVKTR
jgi:predicted DNA-binding transcriptional regulator AlpA